MYQKQLETIQGNGRCEENETERKRWLVELSGQRQEYAKEGHTHYHRDSSVFKKHIDWMTVTSQRLGGTTG